MAVYNVARVSKTTSTDSNFIGHLMKYCKGSLKLDFNSETAEGSTPMSTWFVKYHKILNLMVLSCASLDAPTDDTICEKSGNHLSTTGHPDNRGKKHLVLVKVDSNVNHKEEHDELDITIKALSPFSWRFFETRVLPVNHGCSPPLNVKSFGTPEDFGYDFGMFKLQELGIGKQIMNIQEAAVAAALTEIYGLSKRS